MNIDQPIAPGPPPAPPPKRSKLLFVLQIALGFCLSPIALGAFVVSGNLVGPPFSDSPVGRIGLACFLGIVPLAAGIWYGIRPGRRGILLGMVLSASLIALLIGMCFWSLRSGH
jgi:hypothetical protein